MLFEYEGALFNTNLIEEVLDTTMRFAGFEDADNIIMVRFKGDNVNPVPFEGTAKGFSEAYDQACELSPDQASEFEYDGNVYDTSIIQSIDDPHISHGKYVDLDEPWKTIEQAVDVRIMGADKIAVRAGKVSQLFEAYQRACRPPTEDNMELDTTNPKAPTGPNI